MTLSSDMYSINILWDRAHPALFLSRMSNYNEIFLVNIELTYYDSSVVYTYGFNDMVEDNITLEFTINQNKSYYFDHNKLQSLDHCILYLREIISKDYPEYFI